MPDLLGRAHPSAFGVGLMEAASASAALLALGIPLSAQPVITAASLAAMREAMGWTAPPLQKASGEIPAISVRTLFSIPYQLMAAPAAGFYYEVDRVHWWLVYGGVAYDSALAADSLRVVDSIGNSMTQVVAGNLFGGTADFHALSGRTTVYFPANAALRAQCNVSDWYAAAGNSSLKWEIWYRLAPLSFAT